MSQKIMKIMEILENEFETPYKEIGDNMFEVHTFMSKVDHRIFLKLEISSDVIRCEITHMFGSLNVERDISY